MKSKPKLSVSNSFAPHDCHCRQFGTRCRIDVSGLELLETLFGTVLIPTAVHDEVCAQGKPQADALKAYLVGKVQKVDITEITSRVRLLQNSNAYLNPLLIEQVLQRAGE